MIELKDLGTFESVLEIVIDIVKGNIVALETALAEGWDIHKPIQLGKYSEYSPLELALVMNCLQSVRWLVEHGADLNDEENPSFLLAVRYADQKVIDYVVDHGANIHALNSVEVDAFQAALYGKKYENLQLIHDLGHTVQKYGGKAFRNAIKRGVKVEILLSVKSDIPLTPDCGFFNAHQLMKAGCQIWLYKPGFHHTKIIMVDGQFCTVGSANLNARSLRWDREENAVIIDACTTHELNQIFEQQKKDSFLLTEEKWKQWRTPWQRFRGWFAHLLSPFL